MKIVFINEFISGGGAEHMTCLLAGELVERGYSVTMMTNLLRPFAFEVDKRINKIPLYNTERESKSKVSLFYMVKNTRRMLKQEKPNVLIGVMPIMNFVAVVASAGLNVKVIATHHTSFDRKVGLHIHLIQRFIYPFADVVTVLTQADMNYLGKRLKNKVVMPNPLAFTCVEHIDNQKHKNILAVGRIDVWYLKGFDLLIRAWGKIAHKYPEWMLEIAGDGKQTSIQDLQSIVIENRVTDNVRFLGFRKDIEDVMRTSSIFALTSRVEGFGMVLIEAMSQGCACVSFDDGGRQREIITSDKEGIVIADHDVDKLSQVLSWLIEHQEQRMMIAETGIKRADDYSLDKIGKKWENLLSIINK